MSDIVISVDNFSKSFGAKEVISGMSFVVNRAEVFAFLGANGSGKTTTLRCLLGIYQANTGELLVNGEHYSQDQGEILGYLPEERGLYVSSKVLETMVYFGEIKGMNKTDAKRKAEEYLERVGLADKRDTEIKKLSSGQQQKIQLGITVINSPQLLILDEPTKGLDPVNRALLMEMLDEMNAAGTTILFSSHQMDEVEKIADRLAMIKNGKLELYGAVDEVKSKFGDNAIRLRYRGKLNTNDELYTASIKKNYAEIVPAEGVSTQRVLEELVKDKVIVEQFEVGAPSLNQIFIQVSQS